MNVNLRASFTLMNAVYVIRAGGEAVVKYKEPAHEITLPERERVGTIPRYSIYTTTVG